MKQVYTLFQSFKLLPLVASFASTFCKLMPNDDSEKPVFIPAVYTEGVSCSAGAIVSTCSMSNHNSQIIN